MPVRPYVSVFCGRPFSYASCLYFISARPAQKAFSLDGFRPLWYTESMWKVTVILTVSVLASGLFLDFMQPRYEVADPADDRTLYAENLPKKDGQVLCFDKETGDFKWIDIIMVSDQLKDRLYWFTKNGAVYMAAGNGWKKHYSISDRL